ncbi:N-acetylneuraminate 9-O-acetyltransferase isoform X3 [Hydra vulgaris]|uniref:N-acetylneuraminate 9-O-acetyltransferase isoform X3 n=1 Tax=Hydra vulgaris TaxID=6087 RepID=A0ABM4BR05_HYDVU
MNMEEASGDVVTEKKLPSTPCFPFYNAGNFCKCIAWFIIFLSATFHFYRLFKNDYSGHKCPLLFESGYWIGQQWQPEGCIMHRYSISEIKVCLQNQKVAFIGDSRIRSVYYELVDSIAETVSAGKLHENLRYEDKATNTSIEFYWYPELTDTMEQLLLEWIKSRGKKPDVIIMGVATWTIKKNLPFLSVDYQEKLNSLSGIIKLVGQNLSQSKAEKYDHLSSRFHHERQVIWIQQDPVVEKKLSDSRKTITNKEIDIYNYAAQKILQKTGYVRILKSTALMASGMPEETTDGLHYSKFILKYKVDAILNSFCNNYIYPDDASCCKDLERITKLQFNAFSVLGTCVLLWILMVFTRKIRQINIKGLTAEEVKGYDSFSTAPWLYSEKMYIVIKNMAKLSGIMLYIFLADSSFLYDKSHKQYSPTAFFVVLAVLFVAGVAFRRKANTSLVLNDDQIGEFKGWLILVIILYNYTDVQKILPVFVNVRLAFSFLLFLFGFSHYKYFWYSNSFHLYKVCKILAHMNIFCVVVCLIMGHTYQYYLLLPMLSLWFIVIYFFMVSFPRTTHNIVVNQPISNNWMIAKFSLMFALVFVVWGNETVCDWLFNLFPFRELFVGSDGTIEQWKYSSSLHRYSVLFGMLTAYIYVTLKRYHLLDEEEKWLFSNYKLSIGFLIGSICAFLGYQIQAFNCHTKEFCDHTHSLASFIPIVSFVVMRNISARFRSQYSLLFAWIGDMALELFVVHHHIWLANDSFGVHVLIPDYVTVNALVTSFTFICVAHEVKEIRKILADALIIKDVMVMLRRLILFLFMLVIVWWHKIHDVKPTRYKPH